MLDRGTRGNTDRGESDRFRFGENGVWQESQFSRGFVADWTALRGSQRSSRGRGAEVGNGPVGLPFAMVEIQSRQGRATGDESPEVEREIRWRKNFILRTSHTKEFLFRWEILKWVFRKEAGAVMSPNLSFYIYNSCNMKHGKMCREGKTQK